MMQAGPRVSLLLFEELPALAKKKQAANT